MGVAGFPMCGKGIDMEIIIKKLIDLGWEFSIRYEGGEWSITVWKPDWPSNYPGHLVCPTGKGKTIDEAILDLMANFNLNSLHGENTKGEVE